MKAGGDLDYPLIEVSDIRSLLAPDVLQGLVAVVEAPGIELADGLGEGLRVVSVETWR